jgi:hypothetical protein
VELDPWISHALALMMARQAGPENQASPALEYIRIALHGTPPDDVDRALWPQWQDAYRAQFRESAHPHLEEAWRALPNRVPRYRILRFEMTRMMEWHHGLKDILERVDREHPAPARGDDMVRLLAWLIGKTNLVDLLTMDLRATRELSFEDAATKLIRSYRSYKPVDLCTAAFHHVLPPPVRVPTIRSPGHPMDEVGPIKGPSRLEELLRMIYVYLRHDMQRPDADIKEILVVNEGSLPAFYVYKMDEETMARAKRFWERAHLLLACGIQDEKIADVSFFSPAMAERLRIMQGAWNMQPLIGEWRLEEDLLSDV